MSRHTHWGQAQESKTIANGITEVETASHGGLHLSQKRWDELIKTFPEFHSFAGDRWLEEDCDWAIAVLCWPDLFSIAQKRTALHTAEIEDYGVGKASVLWRQSTAGLALKAEVDAYERAHEHLWELGSMSTGSGTGWNIAMHRGEERLIWKNAPYPTARWYDRKGESFIAVIE